MLKQGINIIKVKNPKEGFEVCKNLLYKNVSKTSVLFLSGGSTPKFLYEILAKEQKLSVGAVAMVDERYITSSKIIPIKSGQKSKIGGSLEGTNEKMISDTGLVSYIENHARFYPILQKNENIEGTALRYDDTVRYLFNYFRKSVGILGIGADGHTAGLSAGIDNSEFIIQNKSDLVTSLNNFPGEYKERITLTFLGLSKLDLIIVLAFGKEKNKALKLTFKEGSVEEVPARFLLQKGIAEKTILITDRSI
ncbi:MAG: 6-phosphogluconolactonase [Patescibacteria group bacterium]|nr:6-phosphogluconolactonase [Patescibacteria group bacterium]